MGTVSLRSPGMRRLLPIYTFFAILAVIVLIGLVAVPMATRMVETKYLDLQGDTNRRQAEELARFVEFRLGQNIPLEEIRSEVNSMLAHADADRGFSCIISQDSLRFVSHPKPEVVGAPVASLGVEFEPAGHRGTRIPMEASIPRMGGREGILYLPGGTHREVVFMQSIPSAGWTVATHENTSRVERELANIRWKMILGFVVLGLVIAGPSAFAARRVSSRYEQIIEERNQRILEEQAVSEKLLLNILPDSIADELKTNPEVIARRHGDASVLFADLVGFTSLAGRITPERLVQILNGIFSSFDDLAETYGLEKIKTIGDSYMVCGNLPEPKPEHLHHLAAMAFAMLEAIKTINRAEGLDLKLRIGMDTGTVVAGVIGKRKFSYDLWGDVVNTASRMESSAAPDSIHVTAAVEAALRGHFIFESLPELEIKGKGRMHTYRLLRPVEKS